MGYMGIPEAICYLLKGDYNYPKPQPSKTLEPLMNPWIAGSLRCHKSLVSDYGAKKTAPTSGRKRLVV